MFFPKPPFVLNYKKKTTEQQLHVCFDVALKIKRASAVLFWKGSEAITALTQGCVSNDTATLLQSLN